jgi:NAD+ synthase
MDYHYILDYLHKHLAGRPAVLGLSGGVDSAVVAYLVAQVMPAERIHSFYLPSVTNAAQDGIDAARVAQELGLLLTTIALEPLLASYQASSSDFTDGLPLMNLKARLRMTLLYGRANRCAGLVVGTGNKTELATGYFTKYGDGGVDLLPIGDLYKSDVWALARTLGVPEQIVAKTPTAGLVEGQTDEAELGMSYARLDEILMVRTAGQNLARFPADQLQRVETLIRRAQHKLDMPAIALRP